MNYVDLPLLHHVDVVILAGGQGTRLRAVLPDTQKVIAPVDGAPFLWRVIERFRTDGARRIVLALGFRAEQVVECLADRPWRDIEIIASIEPAPLGTGGALRFALPKLTSDPVVIANGDSFATVDLARLVGHHRHWRAPITLALTKVDDVARYGAVRTAADGTVVAFEEKPTASGRTAVLAGTVNAGVYVLARDVIAAIPPDQPVSLERDVFPAYVGRGLRAVCHDARFIDIGTPAAYRDAAAFFTS